MIVRMIKANFFITLSLSRKPVGILQKNYNTLFIICKVFLNNIHFPRKNKKVNDILVHPKLLFQIRLIHLCLGRESLDALHTALTACLGSISVGRMAHALTIGGIETEAEFSRLV